MYFQISKKSLLQWILLFILCGQNSIYSLLRRYLQGILKENSTSSSILAVGEFFKFCTSIIAVAIFPSLSTFKSYTFINKIKHFSRTSKPIFILAVIYLSMNLLSYISLQNIDAGLFTVVSQCKLLTTAVFSSIFFKKKLGWNKWRFLIFLALATILIANETKHVGSFSEESTSGFFIGLLAVCFEVILSGFSSVFLEKILKNESEGITYHNLSVWERNIQLSFISMLIYFPICFFISYPNNIFSGWSSLTFFVSIIGGVGGILVALCLKHMDSIVKVMTTNGSIVATTILSHVYFDAPLNLSIFVGSLFVILSVFGYHEEK